MSDRFVLPGYQEGAGFAGGYESVYYGYRARRLNHIRTITVRFRTLAFQVRLQQLAAKGFLYWHRR